MPSLGMGLHLAQTQRLELRQALMPGYFNVDPFRTEGESLQISQYDLVKDLESIVSKGGFIDPEHFSLEINREIFGHTLESGLSTFGGNLVHVLKTYKGEEEFAKKVLEMLGKSEEVQPGRETERDLPGKIVNAWNSVLDYKYFKKEYKEKNVLNLIEYLKEKQASVSDGLAVLAEVCNQEQIHLASMTLAKLREYSERDIRLIPFSQKVLSPVLKAVKGQNLSEEESNLVYKEIVEQLYMLDRDLRNSQGLENISQSLSTRSLRNLLESNLSIPVTASVEALSPSPQTFNRLAEFGRSNEYKDGREIQRKFYHSISLLQDVDNGKEILQHATSFSSDVKSLAKLLSAVSLVSGNSDFQYPFSLTSTEETLKNLRLQLVDGSLRRIGLSNEKLEKYLEKIDKDEKFRKIGEILTTLSGYSHYQNSQQKGLIKDMIEAELDNNFAHWRYSHNLAGEQIAVLEDKTSSWRENKQVTRLVGELDALKSHVGAVRDLSPKLQESYEQHYQSTPNPQTLQDLEKKIQQNEETLRSGLSKIEARDLGHETSLLRERVAYTKLLNGIKKLSPENYSTVLAVAQDIARKRSKNPLFETAGWIRNTLDQPVYRYARKIIVAETDDLEQMLRMGEIPVPHCQNWKNNNSLNSSLLSFPADANKKLYHFINGDGKPFGMSLVRLVPYGKSPMLLVENIYSNEWSEDYGTAFIGSLADKAFAIYEETGKQTVVASPIHSGHQAHGKKNIQVLSALERFAQKYKTELYEENVRITSAKSKNTYEYWDCGFGLVESGKEINLPVKYVSFGESGND